MLAGSIREKDLLMLCGLIFRSILSQTPYRFMILLWSICRNEPPVFQPSTLHKSGRSDWKCSTRRRDNEGLRIEARTTNAIIGDIAKMMVNRQSQMVLVPRPIPVQHIVYCLWTASSQLAPQLYRIIYVFGQIPCQPSGFQPTSQMLFYYIVASVVDVFVTYQSYNCQGSPFSARRDRESRVSDQRCAYYGRSFSLSQRSGVALKLANSAVVPRLRPKPVRHFFNISCINFHASD